MEESIINIYTKDHKKLKPIITKQLETLILDGIKQKNICPFLYKTTPKNKKDNNTDFCNESLTCDERIQQNVKIQFDRSKH